jgi:hypothetical protein
MGFACIGLGTCALMVEDYETVRETQQEAIAFFREIGDIRGSATALFNLGEADIRDGHCLEGREHIAECLRISREVGDAHLEGYALHLLGRAAYEEGASLDAWVLFQDSLRLFAANEDRHGGVPVLQDLALVLSTFDPIRAMQTLASSLTLQADSGTTQSPYNRRRAQRLEQSLHETLGGSASEAWEAGSRLTWSEAADMALNMGFPPDAS